MLHTINYSFNGGNITSEGGALLLEKFLEQIGFQQYMKELFPEEQNNKAGHPVEYSKATVLQTLLEGYLKGHSTPTATSRTKGDMAVETITGRSIPSQSTFSRTITHLTREDETQLRIANTHLLQQYFSSLVKKNGGKKLPYLEISDDSTKIETYGKQEGSAYIKHYQVTGYHPDLVTEDNMRLIMEGILRNGNVYSSNGSEHLIESVIRLFAPYVEKIIFRGDSAYAKPEILEVLRNAPIPVTYFIKGKTYRSWYEKSDLKIAWEGNEYHPMELPATYFEEQDAEGKKQTVERYFKFQHRCGSWKAAETIILQVSIQENKKGQKSLLPEMDKKAVMLITNSTEEGKSAYAAYGQRGKQEKLIEEFKNDSFGGQLSQQGKVQNDCIFMLKIIAHNLMQLLRLTTLYATKHANSRVASMRMLLVRVGGKLIKTARRWILQLSSTFAYQHWFNLVMERIPTIQFHLCT